MPAGSGDFDRAFDMLLTLDLAEIEVPIPNFASDQSCWDATGKQNFDLDDREMHSLARDLASGPGIPSYSLFRSGRSKGSGKVMPLGKVIEKFLAAKSNRSPAYMDKLNGDA